MDWRKRKRFVESCGCVHGEPHTCALYHERAVKAERECEVLRAFNGDPVALDSRRAREKARLAAAERVVEAARPLAESNPHAECDEEACRLGRFINAHDALKRDQGEP